MGQMVPMADASKENCSFLRALVIFCRCSYRGLFRGISLPLIRDTIFELWSSRGESPRLRG